MTERTRLSLTEHFLEVPDPRVQRTQKHSLLNIFAMALCAVIGVADHWIEVVEFVEARQSWFATFLEHPNGVPSLNTFARVFRLIDTIELEKACQQWLCSVATRLGGVRGVVAIDGKSVRGARDANQHPSSAPGPAKAVCCWAKSERLRILTKLRPSLSS